MKGSKYVSLLNKENKLSDEVEFILNNFQCETTDSGS